MTPHPVRLGVENAGALVAGADLVLDGCDSFATRQEVNAACVAAGRPLLTAAMTQWEGQIGLFHPAGGGPCYACVFPQAPAPGLVAACAEAGIIGALPGVMGSLMALEAIKALVGAGTTLRHTLLIYNALEAEMRRIRIRPRPACAVCGGAGG